MSTCVYQRNSKCFSFLQVDTDGFIAIAVPAFNEEYRFIVPYWTDLSTDVGDGHVYYREVISGRLLTTASNHVRQCNSGQSRFSATWVFIATWEGLTYHTGDKTTPVSVCNMMTKVNTWKRKSA